MVDFRSLNKTFLFYTVCIFLNHFAFGITSTVLWPALVDLQYIYDTTNETINYLVTFSSFGYLLGSLSGWLYKWLNRQMTIVLLVSMLSLTIALMPHYGKLGILFGAVILNGIGGGTWDSSNNVWLVELWPSFNAPVIQASQFFYGLGTIVGPIIVSPYVRGENTNTSSWTPEERVEMLTFPFGLTGAIQIVVPITFFFLFFIRRYKKDVTHDLVTSTEDLNSSSPTESRHNVPLRPLKLILMAFCLATYDAAEIAYFYFSPTMFQYLEHRWSAEDAGHLLSVLSAAYTTGRLATAFISIKLKPDVIIAYHFVIILVGHAVLFFGRDQRTVIYIGTVVLGYGFSAMWPAILACTDRYLALTNRVGSLLFFFAGVVSLFTPLIIGRFLQSTPLVLFAFEGGYIAISIALFIVLRILIGFRGTNGSGTFSIFN